MNPLRAGAVAAVVGLTGTPGAGWAQPVEALHDLEALLGTEVEGPSRQLEAALDAPAVVSSISHAESMALGHRTLADMMERLPGIYIGTTRGYATVGLRGLNRQGDVNSRLLMSIDGYRVNGAVYDQAQPGWEFPIVADWVKRLELVSGPASSVYGGNALLGVVNAVTLDGRDAPGVHVRAGLSSWNTRDAVVNYGWHEGGSDLFVGLAMRKTEGETLQDDILRSASSPDGRVSGLDGMRHHSLFLKWRLDGWRLSMASHERVKDLPVAPFGTLPGVPGTNYTDRYNYAELAWDGAWVEDWRGAVRMNIVHGGFMGRYMTGEVEQPVVRRDSGSGNVAGVDARLQWRGLINHELTLGVEDRHIYNARQRNFDESPYALYLERQDSQNQAALYGQDHWRLAERWSLTMGARLDRVAGYPSAFSPRLALVGRPNEHEAVKLLYGQGFRVPSLAERAYEDVGSSPSSNPPLQPERLRSVAMAWERAMGERNRVSVHVYRDGMRELIDFLPVVGLPSPYRNLSRVRTQGMDLEVQGVLEGGVQWRASVTAQSARSELGQLSNTPHWLTKGHVLAPLPQPNWSAALQWMALGRRSDTVPSRVTFDGLLRWDPLPRSSLALRVTNLFNAQNWDAAPEGSVVSRFMRERRSVGVDWRQAF